MRIIKFRGRSLKSNEWFYGNLFNKDDKGRTHISTPERGCLCIDPDTVGQFTGLLDCNGKEIYEGDILVYGNNIKHLVEFKHGMFGYTISDGWFIGYGGNPNFSFNPLDKSKEHEVVGNKYDNPDLLTDKLNKQ